MPPAKGVALSSILVSRLACCADDSHDRGSCRIRLPPSVWAAANVPYHKPVIVSVPCVDTSQPWKLLCVAALADEPEHAEGKAAPGTPQPGRRDASAPSRLTADFAVVDPTVVVLPPGRTLVQLKEDIARANGAGDDGLAVNADARVEVTPCRGPAAVAAAAEVQVRVSPGQEHLASPVMSFKLHQALVLPGCTLRLSDSSAVHIVAVHPPPPAADQPLRIVPSTRITIVAGEQQQQQQQQQEGPAVEEDAARQNSDRDPAEAAAGAGASSSAAADGAEPLRPRGAAQARRSSAPRAGTCDAGVDGRGGGGASAKAGSKSGGRAAGSGKSSGGKAGKAGSKAQEEEGAEGSRGGPDAESANGESGDTGPSQSGASGAKPKSATSKKPTAGSNTREQGGATQGPAEGPGASADAPRGEPPKAKVKAKARKSKGPSGGLTASASLFDALLGLDEDA